MRAVHLLCPGLVCFSARGSDQNRSKTGCRCKREPQPVGGPKSPALKGGPRRAGAVTLAAWCFSLIGGVLVGASCVVSCRVVAAASKQEKARRLLLLFFPCLRSAVSCRFGYVGRESCFRVGAAPKRAWARDDCGVPSTRGQPTQRQVLCRVGRELWSVDRVPRRRVTAVPGEQVNPHENGLEVADSDPVNLEVGSDVVCFRGDASFLSG